MPTPARVCLVTGGSGHRRRPWSKAFSLIELLCVAAIIGILAALMLPAMGKALRKARGVVGVAENRDNISAVIEEISRGYSRYRLAEPKHGRLRLPDFIAVCGLGSRAEQWLKMSPVTFHPFDAQAPGDTVVIEAALSTVSPTLQWRVVDLLSANPPQ